MATATTFPTARPEGYEWLPDEEHFDPDVHLAISEPDEVLSLGDLGYDQLTIDRCVTDVAVSSPFRLLSARGAEVMLETARRLRAHARPASVRIENTVRGGCYRSRFLRDLCMAPAVTEAMSSIYGTNVAPHAMPVHLGHLNYEPTDLSAAVDKWHHDTIPLNYVMMVSDPTTIAGGAFEWFRGTRDEAAEAAARGERPPADRVVRCDFPGPGWVVAIHGSMVVHRGAPLERPGERITMVNAYESLDLSYDLASRTRDLIAVDDPEVLYTEWVRHVAWRARHRLEALERDTAFGLQPADAVTALRHAIDDITTAIADIEAGAREPEHYER